MHTSYTHFLKNTATFFTILLLRRVTKLNRERLNALYVVVFFTVPIFVAVYFFLGDYSVVG